MRIALKILAVIVVGAILGLAATWLTVIRGTMAGAIDDGPWRTSLDAGSRGGGIYLRARVAVHGLLALNRSETMYYTASQDGGGARFDGACTWRIEGRDPPARWWSITAYGADDFLIPNAAGRYSVSKNSVRRAADGRFTITLSKRPAVRNWIALADGRFNVSLRLYNPDPKVAADPQHVVLPTIEKVSCP
jgi:hypothetical protein